MDNTTDRSRSARHPAIIALPPLSRVTHTSSQISPGRTPGQLVEVSFLPTTVQLPSTVVRSRADVEKRAP